MRLLEQQDVGVRVTVLILSHRGEMCMDAWRSVIGQTQYRKHPGSVQILVQHCQEYWWGKASEALSIAQGDWLLVLCDDDLLPPKALERMLAVADAADPTPDLIYSDRIAFRHVWRKLLGVRLAILLGIKFRLWGGRFTAKMLANDARTTRDWLHPNGRPNKGFYWTAVPPQHFATGHWLPMTMLIRTAYWRALGGYNDAVSHADTEFWFRAAKRGGFFAYIPDVLFWYRRHKGQFSQESPSLENAMREFSRAHFADHGLAWGPAHEIEPGIFQVPKIPEWLRPTYAKLLARGLTERQAVRALQKWQQKELKTNLPRALQREAAALAALRASEARRLTQWRPGRAIT